MLMSSSKNFKVNKYVYCGVDPMPQRTRTHNWNQSVAVKISSFIGYLHFFKMMGNSPISYFLFEGYSKVCLIYLGEASRHILSDHQG